jgi:hypothetical protein
MRELNEMIKIADIHVKRIELAKNHINNLFPIDATKIKNLKEYDFAWLELLINRFGKLQDFIGAKIIDLFLLINEENISNLTVLDKINKLEKLGIIKDCEIWKDMRKARNHIAHEYPDNPELTARHLNKIFKLVPELIEFYESIKKRLIK